MDNVKKFRKIAEEIGNLYEKKNAAYGNSFGETYQKLGIISAVARIRDKYNRLYNLAKNPDVDNLGESLEDTLKDMAAYSIMTLMEMSKENQSPIGYDPVKEVDNLITSIKDDKQIRKGDVFECIKHFAISECDEIIFTRGNFYVSASDGCITDNTGTQRLFDNFYWQNYFKRI